MIKPLKASEIPSSACHLQGDPANTKDAGIHQQSVFHKELQAILVGIHSAMCTTGRLIATPLPVKMSHHGDFFFYAYEWQLIHCSLHVLMVTHQELLHSSDDMSC